MKHLEIPFRMNLQQRDSFGVLSSQGSNAVDLLNDDYLSGLHIRHLFPHSFHVVFSKGVDHQSADIVTLNNMLTHNMCMTPSCAILDKLR